MKKRLNQSALVTGAAKRLGRDIALHLAVCGYDIALHYHSSKPEALKTAQAIRASGVRCELFECDLAQTRQVAQLIPNVLKSFANLSVLVNSASIFVPNCFDDRDLTLYDAHWAINFKAPYLLTNAFARLQKSGQVINLIDTNVAKYQTRYSDYLMTKKALAEFTKMAAVQWGPTVRVNGISPGMILAPVNGQKDDRALRASRIPLKQVGNPSFILKAMDALLTNDYITGQIIAVDGGEQLI